MKKHFPLNFHLEYENDLPENAFRVNDTPYNVPCVFQIWIKKDSVREITEIPTPQGFKFVKKSDTPDISLRRVGVYAGKIDKHVDDKSEQSHYFIKFDNELHDSVYDTIANINYPSKSDTVGPRSISKPNVTVELNKIINT